MGTALGYGSASLKRRSRISPGTLIPGASRPVEAEDGRERKLFAYVDLHGDSDRTVPGAGTVQILR